LTGSNSRVIKTAIILMGMSGISAQIMILRELLIISFGNELIIGVILANWLLLEAAGSWLGGKILLKAKSVLGKCIVFQVLFSIFFPLCLLMVRFTKELTGTLPGSGLGFITLFFSSLLILLPVSLIHGMLFPAYCRLFSDRKGSISVSISRVYVWELLGTIIGGFILTYLLIPLMPALNIALLLSLFNLISSLLLFLNTKHAIRAREKQKKPNENLKLHPSVLFTTLFLLILIFLNLYLLTPNISTKIHNYSIGRLWRGQKVIHYQNSIYGNITVTESEEQLTFHSDGQPSVTTPHTDLVFSETFVHLPLLSHPHPESILIIGGGAGGVISEVLRHSPEEIIYAELDPLLIDLVKELASGNTRLELTHPSVRVVLTDGRRYLEQSEREFDIILMNIGTPDNLQTNRFFTVEFYSLLSGRMKEDGILAFSLPGSLSYLTTEMRHLNRITENSLHKVFPQHYVIPGDFNLFLASRKPGRIIPQIADLEMRIKERNIDTQLISKSYLEYILHPRWLKWYEQNTAEVSNLTNSDRYPISVYWGLTYWNSMFSPASQSIFRYIYNLSFKTLLYWLLPIALGIPLLIIFLTKRTLACTSSAVILTSGFSGMILDLAIIYIFQILFGYVFFWIGMLFVSYMSGAMLGALTQKRRLSKPACVETQVLNRLLILELLIIMFALLLPASVQSIKLIRIFNVSYELLSYLYLALPLLSGFLIGSQFPLAAKLYHCGSLPNYEKSSGILYAFDLLGGWFGGIIGGIIMLPLFGLTKTMSLIVLLKVGSLLLISFQRLRAGK